jgi:hypothetical protein
MRNFLKDGMKVKVSLFFRGREQGRTEFGHQLMQRVLTDLQGLCHVEASPRAIGRSLHMMVGPVRGAVKKHKPPASAQQTEQPPAGGAVSDNSKGN